MARAKRSTNTLRIIAGQWRNRKLSFPDAPGLRPTTDRIRETVFNWLQTRIPGARCLDLFAGSGAMGLEALSRGAAQVDFVEQSGQVIQQLTENLKILQADNAATFHTDARHYIQHCEQQYDIIFVDPPYDARLLGECLALISTHPLASPGCVIFLEDNQPLQKTLALLAKDLPYSLLKEKKAGNVYYGLLES